MLSPDDVRKECEANLTSYVNAQIRNNLKMLWKGETLSIPMECDADLKWAQRTLSKYNVAIESCKTFCEHKCDRDCQDDDSDDEGVWTIDRLYYTSCFHFKNECECRGNRYVVRIKLDKEELFKNVQ